jgi:hypothetical protein
MFIYTIREVIAAIIILIIAFCYLAVWFQDQLKKRKCKHEIYYETPSCHAVCKKCRKDLGIIGAWEEKINKENKKRG